MLGISRGVYQLSEWIMRFALTNIIWLFFNFPIVILIFFSLLAETRDEILTFLNTIAILIPFIGYPATVALFSVVRKWVMGNFDIPLFRTFWSYYKRNYVRSMINGLMIVVIWFIWFFNYDFYIGSFKSAFFYPFVIATIYLVIFMLHFTSINVHYQMKLFLAIKNALLISSYQPFMSMTMIILIGLILFISLFKFTVIIPIFVGSLIAFISFTAFYRIVLKLEDKQKSKKGKY